MATSGVLAAQAPDSVRGRLSNDGVLRASAQVDSVFVDRRKSAAEIDGGRIIVVPATDQARGMTADTIIADEAYLRDSIRQPQNRVVKGYAPAMPALPLTDGQIDQLVAYLKSL